MRSLYHAVRVIGAGLLVAYAGLAGCVSGVEIEGRSRFYGMIDSGLSDGSLPEAIAVVMRSRGDDIYSDGVVNAKEAKELDILRVIMGLDLNLEYEDTSGISDSQCRQAMR